MVKQKYKKRFFLKFNSFFIKKYIILALNVLNISVVSGFVKIYNKYLGVKLLIINLSGLISDLVKNVFYKKSLLTHNKTTN